MVEETTKKPSKNYVMAVGRRREAVARVRIYNPSSGKVEVFGEERKRGDIIINKKPIAEYFNFPSFGPQYMAILEKTGVSGKFVVSARVVGGGLNGQLEAFIHGVARALDIMDFDKHHKTLSDAGYLTRDPRTRERRKVGNAGKARRKKSSPKR